MKKKMVALIILFFLLFTSTSPTFAQTHEIHTESHKKTAAVDLTCPNKCAVGEIEDMYYDILLGVFIYQMRCPVCHGGYFVTVDVNHLVMNK